MRFICNFNGLKSVRMEKQRNLLVFRKETKIEISLLQTFQFL